MVVEPFSVELTTLPIWVEGKTGEVNKPCAGPGVVRGLPDRLMRDIPVGVREMESGPLVRGLVMTEYFTIISKILLDFFLCLSDNAIMKVNAKDPQTPEEIDAVLSSMLSSKVFAGTKNPFAVALGRRGGLKGGIARAASMTAKERSEAGRKAAVARWSQERKSQ